MKKCAPKKKMAKGKSAPKAKAKKPNDEMKKKK